VYFNNITTTEAIIENFSNYRSAKWVHISGLLTLACDANQSGYSWIIGDSITAEVTHDRFYAIFEQDPVFTPANVPRIPSEDVELYLLHGGDRNKLPTKQDTAWTIKSHTDFRCERDPVFAAELKERLRLRLNAKDKRN
jgi:hypothetical protein